MQLKSSILIIIAILVLGSASAIVTFSFDSGAVDTSYHPEVRSTEPQVVNGDLVINMSVTYENVNYLMKGNITVSGTGNLVLKNATVVFDSDKNITYGIYVEAGGKLTITDVDNDPDTTDDNSVISANMTGAGSHGFVFHAKKDSHLTIKNSHVKFGTNKPIAIGGKTLANTPGIQVESSTSDIQNCTVSDSGYGVVYNSTVSAKLANVEFTDISARIIMMTDAQNIQLENLHLTEASIGIYSKNSHFRLLRSAVSGLNMGILSLSSESYIDNTVFENNKELSFYESTCRVINNITLTDSPLYLNTTDMVLWELELPMHQNSSFWDMLESISVDRGSELHVLKTIRYNFTKPESEPFPEAGSYTIYDSMGGVVLNDRIDEGEYGLQLEPISIVSTTLDPSNNTPAGPSSYPVRFFHDLYSIIYFYNNYYLNETFSVFDTHTYTFQVGYNNPPELKNDRVTPDSGDTETSFVFFVEYFDADGDMPQFVNLVLDNKSYTMAALKDDDNPQSGIQYRVEFFTLDAGEHTFYFEASDGRELANSDAYLGGAFPIEITALESDKDGDEDNSETFFLIMTICFVSVFIFVIFIIAMNFIVQKKMKDAGGVEPGTLPEDLFDKPPRDRVHCSECGAEIDADATVCPECGEEFEGEEFQCPKCQKLVPEEVDKCPHCGNKFLELSEGEEGTERGRKEEGKTRLIDKLSCSECGAVVDEDMTECPGCGEKFTGEIDDDREGGARKERGGGKGDLEDEDLTFFCSVCGASVRESVKTCPDCGTEFE